MIPPYLVEWQDPTADKVLWSDDKTMAVLQMVEYLLDAYPDGHGTEAGYKRHRRDREAACPACTVAHRLYVADWKAAHLEAERIRHRDYMRRRRAERAS